MVTLEIQPLPNLPSAAAATFHHEFLPQAQAILTSGAQCLTLLFGAGDQTHRNWRLAAVQALALEHAPGRVNALAGGNTATVAATLAYLEAADGVTGQYIPLADFGAGPVIQPLE